MQILFEGVADGVDEIVPSLLEGEEHTHEYGLHVGAFAASVSVAVLAQDDGGANGAFGEIVFEGHTGLVQKGE